MPNPVKWIIVVVALIGVGLSWADIQTEKEEKKTITGLVVKDTTINSTHYRIFKTSDGIQVRNVTLDSSEAVMVGYSEVKTN